MRLILYLVLFSLISTITSGCLGTKYLQEDEKLLYKQKIKGAKFLDKEELSQLFMQKANRQFPFVAFSPYVWFYYAGQKNYDIAEYKKKRSAVRAEWDAKIAAAEGDKKKIKRFERKKRKRIAKINHTIEEGNVLMRWGEPIAIYDSMLTHQTMNRLELYLSSKGYFQAKVDTAINLSGRKVSITYQIDPGPPYVIDTLLLHTGDTAISKIINDHKDESLLKKEENYDQRNITRERERIDLLLKDNGYLDFSRQYIEFNVDTSFSGSRNIAIQTIINQPSRRGYHKVFTVDSINFTTDSNVSPLGDAKRTNKMYRGINYRSYEDQYNEKILSRRIFIKKDSSYSKSNTFGTQRQLSNLDHFRFININYDTTGGKLTANIFTSPLNTYQWSNEVGINVTQGFPGPFYNLSFKKRNVFNGLEIFEVNGRIGIEGVAPATEVQDVYTSVEAGVNATLTFPQFVFPISARAKEQLGRFNPKTRLLTGYTYTDRPEYVRENLNFSNTYSWQNENRVLFNFTSTDVSIINSKLSRSFLDTLLILEQNGNRLINTFRPSFVSSMALNGTWNFNSYGLNFTNSSFFRIYLESGGTSLNFMNTDFLEKEGLEYYKYIKASIDYRRIYPLNENTTLAYRINSGIAQPYSDNKILPYEKYFFAGGSNGIRAWRPRRLGPGSYTPVNSSTQSVSYDFEQQGEILLEGSVELRKNLIGFIDYAAFLDFGNIWMVESARAREGAEFKLDRFYKEIAVGTGFGLRFDFSFLVLRLDAGLKVYDPARHEGKRFILSSGFYDPPFTRSTAETVVFNIGIGYPF